MVNSKNIGKTEDYVYDISLDGTVVNALGMNIVSNTDGFNFELPEKFRYTEEHPYISNGLSRCTKKGAAYTGYDADLAEFNDIYLRDFHYESNAVQKMGCDVDETITASLNLSRKNYVDYFSYKPEGQQFKLVGNTIKSKKMQIFIEKFLDNVLPLLVLGKGQEFIHEYYSYIDRIYNYRIPLREIASKGKIKKTINEYLTDTKTMTKAGRPKSRQAWYELAIRNNLRVDNGDTIYYVNNGNSKSESDVKKITHYFYYNENNEKIEITKNIDKEFKSYKKTLTAEEQKGAKKNLWLKETYPNHFYEEEIIMNCQIVPREVIEAEKDIFCEDAGIEYNVSKYIEMFNKRITPLLVCFKKEIRNDILITNPSDRKYFTEEQCKLSSGEPNKPSDQDTYEKLMTMEDKEISFWLKYNLVPPFVEECGMGTWEEVKNDYLKRMEEERILGIDKEREAYDSILDSLTKNDVEKFIEEGIVPDALKKFVVIDTETDNFLSKNFDGVILGNINDIIDKEFSEAEEIEN